MTKRQVRKRCFKWYGLSKFQTPCTFESLKIFPEIQSRLKHHAEIGCPKKQRFFSCGAQMARRVDGWLSTVVIILHQSSLGLKIDTSGLQARLHLPPQTWVLFFNQWALNKWWCSKLHITKTLRWWPFITVIYLLLPGVWQRTWELTWYIYTFLKHLTFHRFNVSVLGHVPNFWDPSFPPNPPLCTAGFPDLNREPTDLKRRGAGL